MMKPLNATQQLIAKRALETLEKALGVASPAKEYATCRRIMFRHGAGSAA